MLKWLYLTPFLRKMRFCVLTRNSRWPPNMAGKRLLSKSSRSIWVYSWPKNFIEIAQSCTVSEIKALLSFTQKLKTAAKMVGKQFFAKVADHCAFTLGPKNFIEMALSGTVSEINALLCFRQKCNIAANGRKKFFG